MSTQKKRSIFITGSSSGLGRATAKHFASKGWKVQNVAEEVISMGSLDVVFNNAGYGIAGPLEALTDEQILRVVETNMLGAIRTTKAFCPCSGSKRAACSSTPRPLVA